MKNSINIPRRVAIRYLKVILPVLLLAFTLLAGTIYCLDSRNQVEMKQEFSQQVLDQANKTLKTWLDDQMLVLSLLANDARVIAACANPEDDEAVAKANDFLHAFHSKNPFYENFALSANLTPSQSFTLTAVDGKQHVIKRGVFFVDSSLGASIGKSSDAHPMAKALYSEGKPHVITHVYRSLIYGNPAFIISWPVYKEGAFVGAIHVALPMKYFTDAFVNDVKMGQTGYMFMIDEQGLVISHPDKELILNEEAMQQYRSVTNRILGGETQFVQRINNVDKTYTVRKFDFQGAHHVSDWYLVFTQANQEILASSVRFIWLINGFLVVSFLLVIGVVYFSTLKLLHMGLRDALTGLYNRNYLEGELIHLAKGRNNPIGFIALDVDGLKLVNDNFGHDAGDELLLKAGQLIKASFQPEEILVRLGGDEFAVVIPRANATAMQAACQRLYNQLQEYNQQQQGIPLSISVGWAMGSPNNIRDIEEMIKKADQLMYVEKERNHSNYEVLFKQWLERRGQHEGKG